MTEHVCMHMVFIFAIIGGKGLAQVHKTISIQKIKSTSNK